ncbi:MAG: peptidoglycan-binding protein [Clostridia bacterium]
MEISKNYGTLLLKLKKSSGRMPAYGAKVDVADGSGLISSMLSDINGEAKINLPTVDYRYSQIPNPPVKPYLTYDVRVTLSGYITVLFKGVQIFSGIITIQEHVLVRTEDDPKTKIYIISIPEHNLLTKKQSVPSLDNPQVATLAVDNVVKIPQNIIVHLGAPKAESENIVVPFLYYLKNVAASEIFPTWPNASLRSNIIAEITFALNRICNEWYKSQGYDFDITSTKEYDQSFNKDIALFDTISDIVDEIFTNYVACDESSKPIFSDHCDGYINQCAGLSQWGTVNLANEQYAPLAILRYYYGSDLKIKEAEIEKNSNDSFEGVLKSGSESADVAVLESRLNRIAVDYPKINFIPCAEGKYTQSIKAATTQFQKVFGLTPTGETDEKTWYRILFIYNTLKALPLLKNSVERISNDGYPDYILNVGDRGPDVLRIEYYLAQISETSKEIPLPAVDGVYDVETRNSVAAFQRFYGIDPTGTIDETTWNLIVKAYYAIPESDDCCPEAYPGNAIKFGNRGRLVKCVQIALNEMGKRITSIPLLAVDGLFGNKTLSAVKAFQRYFDLRVDGMVGPITWAKLNDTDDVG